MKLLTKDSGLATAMASVCPSGETDELAVSLLSIYESRGLVFALFEALIKQEIEDTGLICQILSSRNTETRHD